MGENNDIVQAIYTRCLNGKSDPYSTARSIDQAIGGLTRVDYDLNKTLRVYNHDHNIGFSTRGISKRQRKNLDELVVLMHAIAAGDESDRTQVSSIRIEARTAMSTKHYRKSYDQYQQKVLAKYAA